ncbi:MAG TPA: glycoside hydrolase family 18 protein [Verrucomicrobiae bacterium]|nr:glycoside hydrolase family 18 protein [Verrucomicrobiae bacterium]
MKQLTSILRLLFVIGTVCLSTFTTHADLWSTGYYPCYEQGSTKMPASQIDFTALTHIIHFSVYPNTDGTLSTSYQGLTLADSTDLVTRAHAAGKPVLICVGGGGSESAFEAATSTANLPVFINNLTNFMATRSYDGVDIDWEPVSSADYGQFTNLVNGLRSALNIFPQHKLLTVAAGAYKNSGSVSVYYGMYAALQSQFDQINIMTYDMSDTSLKATWFNSPIYDGNYHAPTGLAPSINVAVSNFVFYGVSPAKLGIGIPFYGYIWAGGSGTSTGGVTQPRQTWTTAPTVTTPSYTTIMSGYYQSNLYYWDTNAQAAYLSISNTNSANDMFISYDDQRACQSKVSYARNQGLGGVIIWELALDHQTGQPDPLLEAVKQALATPGLITIQNSGQDIALDFNGLPLGSYSVKWSGDLNSNVWNTLVVTNVSGPGGVIQVVDPDAVSQTQRFYRVQTPP